MEGKQGRGEVPSFRNVVIGKTSGEGMQGMPGEANIDAPVWETDGKQEWRTGAYLGHRKNQGM